MLKLIVPLTILIKNKIKTYFRNIKITSKIGVLMTFYRIINGFLIHEIRITYNPIDEVTN